MCRYTLVLICQPELGALCRLWTALEAGGGPATVTALHVANNGHKVSSLFLILSVLSFTSGLKTRSTTWKTIRRRSAQRQDLNMQTKDFLLGCVTLALLLQLSSAGLVKKVIRHRREALMPKKTQENLTLPHPDQPVVFNHVYNINVPSTSLCSVDLDSPGGTELKQKGTHTDPRNTEHMEHTVDGDNQIVFTHRINIPKQACGCNNQQPDIKEILNRLEMLESELSSLREQCNSGAGCCGAQVTGAVIVCPSGTGFRATRLLGLP